MKSPINGQEMMLTQEKRSLEFRKESFEVIFQHYYCEASKEYFTTTSIDEVNINQVYNQFRVKHNIPFPEEIIKIREKYDLSATKMAEILGMGTNSYRNYEAGEIPNLSNARLIQMAKEPESFLTMVKLNDSIDDNDKAKILKQVALIIEKNAKNFQKYVFEEYLIGKYLADIYSGYRNPDFEKFAQMVVFFSEKLSPYKTKMNKLLFYADFLMFKNTCFSISGFRYIAIGKGPVPDKFQSIFEYLNNSNLIDIKYMEFPNGNTGEQFRALNEKPFDNKIFNENELKVLETVAKRFESSSTSDIIEISHLEEAWKQNEKGRNAISYQYAFELTQI
jgi:transcriptional regulator with XRE-family HTH domain